MVQTTAVLSERGRPLEGKSALVTGAPRSIGRAIAERLAERGAAVAVHYHNREDEADATVKALEEGGARSVGIHADLTDVREIEGLFDEAGRALGGLDIVVANAGVTSAPTLVAEVDEEEFDRVLAVNTRSVFFVLREAARRVRDDGRIINVSSSTTWNPQAGYAVYATSKSGPNSTVRVLAQELGPRGITANSVVVGPVADGFLAADSAVVVNAPEGALDRLAATNPAGRLGTPEDAAGVAAFLATPEAGWVNGQLILVNGGGSI